MKIPLVVAAVTIQVLFLQPLFNSAGTAAASSHLDKAATKADKQRIPNRSVPASKPQSEAQIKRRNQIKRLESRGRSINRLQRSRDPKQRQQAQTQHRELMRNFKQIIKKFGIPTKIITRPKVSAQTRRGQSDKLFPEDKCTFFFESAKTACYLTEETNTKCIYHCYDKEDEPVGVN